MDDLIDQLAESVIDYIQYKREYAEFYEETQGQELTQETGRRASALIGAYSKAHGEIATALNGLIYRQLLEYGLLAPENEEQ